MPAASTAASSPLTHTDRVQMRFTCPVWPAPRYWVMRMVAAMLTTVKVSCTTVMTVLALPTAATAVSLKWLSCTWSMLPTSSCSSSSMKTGQLMRARAGTE